MPAGDQREQRVVAAALDIATGTERVPTWRTMIVPAVTRLAAVAP
jgi:hypothetical protein